MNTDPMKTTDSTKTIVTFGTFDLFHYGHLRIIERAAGLGTKLVVGVSSDKLNWDKKQVLPVVGENERMAIVKSLGCVSEVFLEESLDKKREYVIRYNADILVMGDDHNREYDEMLEGTGCKCIYFPRTAGVSTTQIKRQMFSEFEGSNSESCSTRNDDDSCNSEESSKDMNMARNEQYSAISNNLVRASEPRNRVMGALLDAHDWYYDQVMNICTPFCAKMPRDINILGFQLTIFTANIVTYARGMLVFPIALLMKNGYLCSASFSVLFHDFLDHLDGVVAKQQAKEGRSKGDDSVYGAFIDAQMDKLVLCLSMWAFLLLLDHNTSYVNIIVVLTLLTLMGLESCIACVRCSDYFKVKYAVAYGSLPAVRAVCEGKLKQKFESIGLALYCFCLPNPAEHPLFLVAGSVCLWFAAYFSTQSLLAKRPDALKWFNVCMKTKAE